MQISKRTKYKFGEFATAFAVLRQIDDVFVAEDFEPVENYSGLASGMRRSLVAGYHAADLLPAGVDSSGRLFSSLR